MCTSANLVWVRRGSHTYQRGWCVNHPPLTHTNTRWRKREQQKYHKAHFNEATFSTTPDWPQVVGIWSVFMGSRPQVSPPGIQWFKLFFNFSSWDQSKICQIWKPGGPWEDTEWIPQNLKWLKPQIKVSWVLKTDTHCSARLSSNMFVCETSQYQINYHYWMVFFWLLLKIQISVLLKESKTLLVLM